MYPEGGELEYMGIDPTDLWKIVQAPSLPRSLFASNESTRENGRSKALNLHFGLEWCLRWILCVSVGLMLVGLGVI